MVKNRHGQVVVSMLAFTLLFFSFEPQLSACTAFNYTKDGATFVGNNEDWKASNPTILVYPKDNGDYGRIYIAYWWMFFWMPFAGVNEHGLTFDIFLVDDSGYFSHDWNKWFNIGLSLATEAMKTCENVEEVEALFKRYNLIMPGHQLFFTDRNGDSVVIGGGEYERKEGNYQVVTNHLLFNTESASPDSINRYLVVSDQLDNMEEMSVAKFASICETVSKKPIQENGEIAAYPTQYSYVIDLNGLKMYLFRPGEDGIMDYKDVSVLDITEQISSAPHHFQINDIDMEPL